MSNEDDDAASVDAATEATSEMATYYLRALRDQKLRAHLFEQRLRWARMRRALTPDDTPIEVVADDHALDSVIDNVIDIRVNSSVVLPEPRLPADT